MRPILQILGLSVFLNLSACSFNQESAPIQPGETSTVPRQEDGVNANIPPQINPPISNLGNGQTYTVKQSEGLYRIGVNLGIYYKDLARWNNIQEPYSLEVGQVLRLTPPNNEVPYTPPTVVYQTTPNAGTSNPSPNVASPSSTAKKNTNWLWPTMGGVTKQFSTSTKGIDIAGKMGQNVIAVEDGIVAYSGAGIRGYGNLIIIRHDKTYLTAYAHNRKLLVKENQSVKKGQLIAEMGDSDTDKPKLHFEVREYGKPVDPIPYLKNQ
ncbi:MAG: peptidoglycan DD-metalloendopeptidase family protein [Neisseriaceae bacterium]|nr:peptidoglycan DD-metalloendopeptidase family protein [Neisseriaceae bacterium]